MDAQIVFPRKVEFDGGIQPVEALRIDQRFAVHPRAVLVPGRVLDDAGRALRDLRLCRRARGRTCRRPRMGGHAQDESNKHHCTQDHG